MTLARLLNSQSYPLDNPDSAAYTNAVAAARIALAEDGCAVLKRFITDETLRTMSAEIEARKSATHYSQESINPYFHTQINLPPAWNPGRIVRVHAGEIRVIIRAVVAVYSLESLAKPVEA